MMQTMYLRNDAGLAKYGERASLETRNPQPGPPAKGRVMTALGAVQARERRIVCGVDGGQLRLDRGEAL